MDFIHSRYKDLLAAIRDAGLNTYTVREFILQQPPMSFAILRHDVEYKVGKSMALAEIETSRGICATYYFHGLHRKVCNLTAMKALQGMGHEIGYHYETLDLCAGDFKKAITLFEEQLKQLREQDIAIDTVCCHGNPRIRKIGYVSNGDIFTKEDGILGRNGLLGEAYASIDFERLQYLSDVGIRWNKAKNTNDLICKIGNGTFNRIYILTHPDYWSKTVAEALAWRYAAKVLRATKLNKVIARFR